MGTRALIHFAKGDEIWATVYKHSDGYPTGAGALIKKVLGGYVMRNGVRREGKEVAGPGCAAATFVAATKDGPGQIYIYKTGTSDVWEDYIYTVGGDYDQPLRLKVMSARPRSEGGKVIYDGPLDDFDPEAVEKSENEDE